MPISKRMCVHQTFRFSALFPMEKKTWLTLDVSPSISSKSMQNFPSSDYLSRRPQSPFSSLATSSPVLKTRRSDRILFYRKVNKTSVDIFVGNGLSKSHGYPGGFYSTGRVHHSGGHEVWMCRVKSSGHYVGSSILGDL